MSLEQRVEAIEERLITLFGGDYIASNKRVNAAQYEAATQLSIDAIISNAIQNDSDTQRYAGRIHG